MSRARRAWTAQEDQLLREAVAKEDPGNPNPSKWHAIAQHVPDRTNKDCRKRWFAKMASDNIIKGGWSPEEDERLLKAIDQHGTKWSIVAGIVGTRNSDQCAKRWTDTLNPSIDRSHWSAEADATLIRAVEEHGKMWTKIVRTYFPGRTGLSAKNRYNSITRAHADPSSRRNTRTSSVPAPSASSTSTSASPSSSVHDLPHMTPAPVPFIPSFYHHHPPPSMEPYRGVMPIHVQDYQFPGNGTMHPGHNGPLLTRTYLPPPVTTSYRPLSIPLSSSGLHLDSSHHHSHPELPLDPLLIPLSRLPPLDHHHNHHHPHPHHHHHHHHPLSPMLEPRSSTGSENELSDSH